MQDHARCEAKGATGVPVLILVRLLFVFKHFGTAITKAKSLVFTRVFSVMVGLLDHHNSIITVAPDHTNSHYHYLVIFQVIVSDNLYTYVYEHQLLSKVYPQWKSLYLIVYWRAYDY